MRVGVICPTRDRPQFLGQFKKYLASQTLQPEIVEIVDFEPTDDEVDVTKRYRYGYDKLRGLGLDIISFMEDDEFYHEDYLKIMVDGWVNSGKPKIFGLSYTIYYHLFIGKSFVFKHDKRSSAMSTLIRPDMDIEWCKDSYPYTDSHLWRNIEGKTFNPKKEIVLGLKHGLSKCAGQWHKTNLERYKEKNIDFRRLVGDDNYAFYRSLYPPTTKLLRDKAKGLYLHF